MKKHIKNGLVTILTIAVTFILVLILEKLFVADKLIPMLFVLGVFVVALKTDGYVWGVAASVLGVLAVNYAFMFPYYAIDLLSPVNLTTAVIMLIVAIATSTLTTQISHQQTEKALSERERMRAGLLRAISHDLRTPLTSIYGACSVIIDSYDSLSKEKQLSLLSDVRKDADWLIRMVENLLSVTRIDDKHATVFKTSTVLEELIDSSLVKFHKHYPNQDVSVTIPDEFLIIPMDAMLIEQVLFNLLENAALHAEGMTELKLTVYKEDEKAVFSIQDNGCGLPKARIGRMFSGTTDKDMADGGRTGMGIGLYVCAAIVKAHGSEIIARNRPEGGAEFTFSLDTEEANEQ